MNFEASILIVDDTSTMRKIVKNMLSQIGFKNVLEANDGESAWTMLEETIEMNEPNLKLILCDWKMPHMSGIDLLKKVRAHDILRTIPFILIAMESDQEKILEAAKAGATNYLVKPFTISDLRENIEKIFKQNV